MGFSNETAIDSHRQTKISPLRIRTSKERPGSGIPITIQAGAKANLKGSANESSRVASESGVAKGKFQPNRLETRTTGEERPPCSSHLPAEARHSRTVPT